MAKYDTANADQNVIDLLIAENNSLKNGLVVSVADLQTEQVQQAVKIEDHETRITDLEP